MEDRKARLLLDLSNFVEARPGLDPRDYIRDWSDKDGRAAYFAEARAITKDLHHARALIFAVQWRDSLTADDIIEASKRAFSGRLTIEELPAPGRVFSIGYCTGQYFPTEYRKAVCAVLSSALWAYWRESLPPETEHFGHAIQTTAKRELPRAVANRYFH